MSAPDRYAVVGYPVKHSRSPFIHAMFAKQCDQNISYQMMEVLPQNLDLDVKKFFESGGKGLNITVPHKQAVRQSTQFQTPRAELAGAVNTIVLMQDGSLLGDNTDGVGLLTDLTQNLNMSLQDTRILVLGAGGAARGILAPLLQQAPTELVIANRNIQRADQLVEEFMTLGSLSSVAFADIEAAPFDMVINATSASLQGEMPELPAGIIGENTLCYDMAYSNGDTVFTRWAKQQGAEQAVLGWGMLVEQAAESFFLWRGVRPDTKPVLEALLNPAPKSPLSK